MRMDVTIWSTGEKKYSMINSGWITREVITGYTCLVTVVTLVVITGLITMAVNSQPGTEIMTGMEGHVHSHGKVVTGIMPVIM